MLSANLWESISGAHLISEPRKTVVPLIELDKGCKWNSAWVQVYVDAEEKTSNWISKIVILQVVKNEFFFIND